MKRRVRSFWLSAASVLVFLAPDASVVSAESGSAVYEYLIGTGILCEDPLGCPDIAETASGERITLTGTGKLSIHPKAVDGGGTFTHHTPGGDVSGTWSATRLLGFDSYGTQPDLPPDFEGGLALIQVQLKVGGAVAAEGVLRVTCLVGKFPPGAREGIRLAVEGGPNFNREVFGHTVFIRQ